VSATTAAASGRRGLEAWAGLGGILYAVLFVVGAILALGGAPDGDAAPAKVIRYYSDSGHRGRISVGWILIVLGVFFFLWFLGRLWQVVRGFDTVGVLSLVVAVGGAVYAALTLAGIALNVGIRTMSDDTYHHQVFPELIHAAGDASYVIHASGGIGVGAMMIAASVAALRAGALPGWVGWLSVAFGIIALFSVLFFPQFAILIWMLVAGWLVFRATPASVYGAQSAPR
jgi:hypothetical protein